MHTHSLVLLTLTTFVCINASPILPYRFENKLAVQSPGSALLSKLQLPKRTPLAWQDALIACGHHHRLAVEEGEETRRHLHHHSSLHRRVGSCHWT